MFVRVFATIIGLLSLSLSFCLAQETGTIQGFVKVKDLEFAVTDVHIYYVKDGATIGAYTDEMGYYRLTIPANEKLEITFSHTSYRKQSVFVKVDPGEEQSIKTIFLDFNRGVVDLEYEVIDYMIIETDPIAPLPPPEFPSVSGDFNATLAFAPGVSMNNELSSGYSVRGGNFNENLVYVNDIMVYRPFLVRSGQQEGLSFVNPNLVDSIVFSAGGWNAKYGDKLSSVLDITYKEPDSLGFSVTASLLGGSIHFEDASPSTRFTQIHGVRYKTNQYVLNSLDVQGDYRPSFIDYQTFLTYDLTTEWELNILGNYSRNLYNFVPQNRETEFGNVNQALRLTVYFDGQEISAFESMTGAVAGVYTSPNRRVQMKFIGSAFHTSESETYDVQGQYWLDELERDLGSDDFGDIAFNRGVGTFLNHARNELQATIISGTHNGRYVWGDTNVRVLEWGARYQHEIITDRLSEWEMLDSAGFSLPIAPSDQIVLQEVIKSNNDISSSRITGFVQNKWSWKLPDTSNIVLFTGVRANYWTYNQQTVISPRINIAYQPNWKASRMVAVEDTLIEQTFRRNVTFKFATGFYYQPPFYRELRGIDGTLNPEVRAQQSIHFVASMDYDFFMWNRPFKLSTAAYYKHLSNLIPYEIDNVRIRYYAENNAKGYATGLDIRLNGEFIPGIESFASLGILQTKEDILDDYYYDYYNSDGDKIVFGYTENDTPTDSVRTEPGFIPRPTNQTVNFALFFQDEMPKWPQFKVHLSLFIGSPLPFGPPSYERYKDTLVSPMYRRVDVGFSYDLLHNKEKMVEGSWLKNFQDLWVSVEVFNLLGISNTVSYLWIKDVTNRQYAIPNFLTSRRINIKIHARF